MKKFTLFASLLLFVVLLSGCGAIPEKSEAVTKYMDSGVNPDSWVKVPAALF